MLKYLSLKIDLYDDKREEIVQNANEILKMFYKQHPNAESSYFAHCDFINGKEKKKAKLKEAVRKLTSCPRCALKLADILCDEGNYNNARTVLEKCLLAVQTSSNHNRAYVYYLLGVCELGIFQNKTKVPTFLKIENSKDKEARVKKIYEAFRIAKSEYLDLQSVYKKEIDRKIYVLEQQTGIIYQ